VPSGQSRVPGFDSSIAMVVDAASLLLVLLVGTKAQMVEDVGDVMEHRNVHSLVLLGEVDVVCEVLADLVLLLAQGVDLGHEVHDPLHDRVLIIILCRARRTYLRTIRTLHTWSSPYSVPPSAALEPP
jgi:hypothetical protein